MRIVRIRREGNSCSILTDTGELLRCPLPIAADFRLRKGDELSPERLAELEHATQCWHLRTAALRFLARRAHSRAELRRKLLRRAAVPTELVEDVLDALEREGYLDDAAYAREFAQSLIRRKATSALRLELELRRRGIEPALAQSIAAELLPEELVYEQARRAAQRKLRLLAAQPTDKQRRAVAGYLARQGFPAPLIGKLLRELFPHAAPDTDEW